MEETPTQRLQERLAWLEKHVQEQDKAMLEMADELQRVRKLLLQVRDRLGSGAGGEEGGTDAEERPPHY